MKLKIFFVAVFLIVLLCTATSAMAITDQERAALISKIQAQIAILLAQVKGLQAQQQSSVVNNATDFPGWCHNFNKYFAVGSSGTEVKALQTALTKEGLYTDVIDGKFDSALQKITKQFQAKYKIDVISHQIITGSVGQYTRAKLNELYGCSSDTDNDNDADTDTDTDTNNNDTTTQTIDSDVPFVKIISPNGGETLNQGGVYNIKWVSSDLPTDDSFYLNVTNYSTNSYYSMPVTVGSLISSGSYNWTVPKTGLITPGPLYKVSISDTKKLVSDTSDDYFTIAVPVVVNNVPSVKLTINGSSGPVAYTSGIINLGYSIKDASSCSLNNDIQGSLSRIIPITWTSEAITPPPSTYARSIKYTLTCFNSAGNTSSSVVLNVSSPNTASCVPNWQKGEWSVCTNGQQTRTVADTNNCGTTANKPESTQSCGSTSVDDGSIKFTMPVAAAQYRVGDMMSIKWTSGDIFVGQISACLIKNGENSCSTIVSNYCGLYMRNTVSYPGCRRDSFFPQYCDCNVGSYADPCEKMCKNISGEIRLSNTYASWGRLDWTTPETVAEGDYQILFTGQDKFGAIVKAKTQQFRITASTSCTDSDGGKNYFTAGTVNGKFSASSPYGFSTVMDTCDKTRTPNQVVEVYCGDDGYIATTRFDCTYGCENSACKPTPGCTSQWDTGAWSACANGQRTRTVTDLNHCVEEINKPVSIESCVSTCNPNWVWGSQWSTCVNGLQTRTATDTNNCGTAPAVQTQVCTVNINPLVTFTAPASWGLQWMQGTTHNITWTSSNIVNMSISLINGGLTTPLTIATNVQASSGSYSWQVPSSLATGSYNIKITDTASGTYFLSPYFTVTAPQSTPSVQVFNVWGGSYKLYSGYSMYIYNISYLLNNTSSSSNVKISVGCISGTEVKRANSDDSIGGVFACGNSADNGSFAYDKAIIKLAFFNNTYRDITVPITLSADGIAPVTKNITIYATNVAQSTVIQNNVASISDALQAILDRMKLLLIK